MDESNPLDSVSGQELGDTDVVIVGGGNAALCAAISAREQGARVLLLERDQAACRGGNSKYTRNIRLAHSGQDGYPPYGEDELLQDLVQVTGKEIDLEMARFTIRESQSVSEWMERHGVTWQPALRGTLQLGRTNRFFLGGGKALLNTYYRVAEHLGVQIRYSARVQDLDLSRGPGLRVVVDVGGRLRRVSAPAVVAASGGFESNIKWLKRYWGEAANNYVIRGTSSNDGLVLDVLLRAGAMERGNPKGFHAVAVDARSPKYDGGIVTRVDSIPFGIVVNRHSERFSDEGEDLWPKRYAVWGRLIAEQDDQIAYSIFDSKVSGLFIPPLYPPIVAESVPALAQTLGLDPDGLANTVSEFNRHAPVDGVGDPNRLDGRATTGLSPAKSNWARPIDTVPICAYPLRPGITFTYLGVGVDQRARVLDRQRAPIPGVFAAGEIMAGNILLRGYLGGFGMTIGTVFGRIAGKEAANYARSV